MNVVDTLAPVFLLIGIGALLVRSGFLKKEMLRGMNDLTYWVALPVLLFYKIAEARFSAADAGPLLTVFFIGTAVSVGAGYAIAIFSKMPAAARGTFVQASFRGNLAFIGLPVVLFAFAGSSGGEDLARTEAAAATALAPILVIYNVVAVVVLYASHVAPGGGLVRKVGRQAITNPLIVASVLGGLYSFIGFGIPSAMERTLGALSQMALPLALLCIGGSLMTVPVRGNLKHAFLGAFVKVAVAPLAGFAAAWIFGVDRTSMLVAAIYLAAPTAAASYVLARQLGGDESLAASTVVISTVLSLVSLSVVVAMV